MRQLADPAVRTLLDERARSKEAGVFRGPRRWGTYVIGDTYSPANEGCAFRSVADIAAERGTAPFDTLLDIVLADDLRTVLWPNTDDGDEATVGHARRDLERPARHGRRVRRRGAPRPHVRLELPDRVPGRLPARPQAGAGREGRAHDDGAAGAAVRPPRAGPDPRGLPRRPVASSTPRRSGPSRHGSCTTCPATRRGSTPAPTGSPASWSTGSRPSATAPPPARCPAAPALGPRHRLGGARPGLSPQTPRRRLACLR